MEQIKCPECKRRLMDFNGNVEEKIEILVVRDSDTVCEKESIVIKCSKCGKTINVIKKHSA